MDTVTRAYLEAQDLLANGPSRSDRERGAATLVEIEDGMTPGEFDDLQEEAEM